MVFVVGDVWREDSDFFVLIRKTPLLGLLPIRSLGLLEDFGRSEMEKQEVKGFCDCLRNPFYTHSRSLRPAKSRKMDEGFWREPTPQ